MSWIPEKYNHISGTHCWFCDREFYKDKRIYQGSGGVLYKTKEHIIPKSAIVYALTTNYIASCPDCNSIKGNKDARQFAESIEKLMILSKEIGHPISKLLPLMKIRAWKLYNKTSHLHKHFKIIRLKQQK